MGVDAQGHVFVGQVGSGPFGVARSLDNGTTWTFVLPTAAGAPTHTESLDPYMYVDPTTSRVFSIDLLPTCAAMSISDDAGATWLDSAPGCGLFDHETVFAGKPVTSTPIGYPNVVYYCAFMGGATTVAGDASGCQKSLDGGLTWALTGEPAFPPMPGTGNYGSPACNAALGHGAVGADGTIYLPAGRCGVPLLAISHDEGLTWTRVQVSDVMLPVGGPGPVDDGVWAHEAGVGADARGNVYYFWNGPDRLPRLAVSHDGGVTWGKPLAFAIPGLRQVVLPELIVGGPGKLAMAFLGSMNAPPVNATGAPPSCLPSGQPCINAAENEVGLYNPPASAAYANATWNGYIVTSTDAMADNPTFEWATVNPPSDPLVRGDCGVTRCGPEFDFVDVRIGPDGTPWAVFLDGCEKACATGASMENDAKEAVAGRVWGGATLLG